jgi:ABC-type phosphonate transport system ATPase subunit
LSLIPTSGVKYQVLPSLRTAYDYLDKIDLKIGRINLDLFPGDSLNIIGSSSVLTNTLLTKACVTSLLPKRYGRLGNSSMVFILDAGNSMDVYQFIEFKCHRILYVMRYLNYFKNWRADSYSAMLLTSIV